MKNKVIIVFCLLLGTIISFAQETIEIEGVTVKKEKLKQSNSINLDTLIYDALTIDKLKKENKFKKRDLYSSSEGESYVTTTVDVNVKDYEFEKYENSKVKFYDKQGKLKWEKDLPEKQVFQCFLSDDGKFCTVYYNPKEDFPNSSHRNLVVFDEGGNQLFPDLENVKFQFSPAKDFIFYRFNDKVTKNESNKKESYGIDLRTGKTWHKQFDSEIQARDVSSNGNYMVCLSNDIYYVFDRAGIEIMRKDRNEVGTFIFDISNDGKYFLSRPNPVNGKSIYYIYNIRTFESIAIPYLNVENAKIQAFNGGCFVKNSKNLVALASIVAPWKAMVIFFDFDGTYLGHKVFTNIKSSFLKTVVKLNADGTLNVTANSYNYGDIKLPAINPSKYYKQQ